MRAQADHAEVPIPVCSAAGSGLRAGRRERDPIPQGVLAAQPARGPVEGDAAAEGQPADHRDQHSVVYREGLTVLLAEIFAAKRVSVLKTKRQTVGWTPVQSNF